MLKKTCAVLFCLILLSPLLCLIKSEAQEEDEYDQLLDKFVENLQNKDHSKNVLLLEKYTDFKKQNYLSANLTLIREYYLVKKYKEAAALSNEMMTVISLYSLGVLKIKMMNTDRFIMYILTGAQSYRMIGLNTIADDLELRLKSVVRRQFGGDMLKDVDSLKIEMFGKTSSTSNQKQSGEKQKLFEMFK